MEFAPTNWTHTVAILFRCCGKAYKVETKEANYCILFAPQCACYQKEIAPYNCFVQNVITDGNGCATLYCGYYSHGGEFSTTKNKDVIYNANSDKVIWFFPKESRKKIKHVLQQMTTNKDVWVCAVSQHENLSCNLNAGNVFVLDSPTSLFSEKDFCDDVPRASLISFDARFDTRSCKLLQDYIFAHIFQNNSDCKRLSNDISYNNDTDDDNTLMLPALQSLDNQQIKTFEQFNLLFDGRDARDATVWKYCDRNAHLLFEHLRQNAEERERVVEHIENINGKQKQFWDNKQCNTYYGSRLLIYLLNLQNNPFINHHENKIFKKVKHIFKDDTNNAEIEQWCLYNGNIDQFKTVGLFKTIQKAQFDAAYDWFVNNMISNTPQLINRSKIVYYCNNSECESASDAEQCNGYYYTVLLSDAIRQCAADNKGTFEIKGQYRDALRHHKLINVEKYKELWRFFDLLNVFRFTNFEMDCYDANRFTNKTNNAKCNWHITFEPCNNYYTLYNRYFQSAFYDLLQNVYYAFMAKENSFLYRDIICRIQFAFSENFVEKYLKPHKATHYHTVLANNMRNCNSIPANWPAPKNCHVLEYERERFNRKREQCVISLQRRIKHKLSNRIKTNMYKKLKKI
ncbi:hypothetical protein [Condylorrhiza vestigialis mutiple nucleopolyhedrovirus]|uniref:Uncharacterized protein n=1 Tax=Condylorrhiza vestigialis mutiple nucleopolyhedrovirus TaxID=1592576 RepID=A0A0B4ULE1_9ABAC|nr:hypothetical protein [Condylorrhiza vestigialis mutiple nucleopolyhedrovirus]AJD09276.1 hypothetical protein [Condylorrhiza vestigialis mutiple nucleopolyhedrovirus]